MSGQHFPYGTVNRLGSCDVAEGEVIGERFGVNLPRHTAGRKKGLQLGTEEYPLGRRVIVERLLAQTIARQQQLALARVPQRDGEHPPEACEAPLAVVLVKMNNRFGIRVSGKAVSVAL